MDFDKPKYTSGAAPAPGLMVDRSFTSEAVGANSKRLSSVYNGLCTWFRVGDIERPWVLPVGAGAGLPLIKKGSRNDFRQDE